MALTKGKPTNLLKNIGVVGTEGYTAGARSLERLANTADRISDMAYKQEANKLETEAQFAAKHDPIKWQDNFVIEGPEGDFKITQVYEDDSEQKLLYTFKTPVENELLPAGKIYNDAYNKERDGIFEKSLIYAVSDFARQAETNNILNPDGYMAHVSAYLDTVRDSLGGKYENTLLNLENDVISRHYDTINSQVAQLELEQANYKQKSNLIDFTNTVVNKISEIGHIDYDGEPSFTIERGENNQVIINYAGENIAELDSYVSLLNDTINDVENNITVPTESKLSWIDSQFKKLALTMAVNKAKTLKVEGEPYKTDNNFDNFISDLKLGTSSNNKFVQEISSLVKNDKAAMGGIYELINSYHLDLKSLNNTDFTQTKMAIKNHMVELHIELMAASQSGNRELYKKLEKEFNLNLAMMVDLFPEFADSPQKKAFINEYKLEIASGMMFLDSNSTNKYKQLSSDTSASIIKDLLNDDNWHDIDSLVQAYQKWEDNDVLPNIRDQDHNRIRKLYLSRYSQLDAENGVLNDKMGWIYHSLDYDGSYPVPNDKTHRDGLSLYFQTKQDKFENEVQTTISNSNYSTNKSGLSKDIVEGTALTDTEKRLGYKEPKNDWNMKLQYFAKYGILDSQTYNQMNRGFMMGGEFASANTRMFMDLKHLRDERGGHVGTQILASLSSDAFMFYELMEEVLQGMPPSQWSTGYEAVQTLIESTKKDTLDNRNRQSMAERFGTVQDIKKYMEEGIDEWLDGKIDISDVEDNPNLYNDIMDMYIVNMGMGTFEPQKAMNDAIVKTVMQSYAKSDYAFDTSITGFKEEERFTQLPPELVFKNANLPLEDWLVPYIQEEIVKDIDWEGLNLSISEEKETVKVTERKTNAQGARLLESTESIAYYINTDPTDPDQREPLVLGKNLYLKVYEAPRGQYPTYQLYYITTESSGYANYGQMVKLRKKDGTDLIIDFAPEYKKATNNWREKFYEEQWENWLHIKDDKKREFKQKIIDTIESFGTY